MDPVNDPCGQERPLPCSRCGESVAPEQATTGFLVNGSFCGACFSAYAFPEEQRRLAAVVGACP